ncbi:hypothetical protein LSH36_1720g00000, partial [Paralvinella palmiformis]
MRMLHIPSHAGFRIVSMTTKRQQRTEGEKCSTRSDKSRLTND